MIACMSGTNTLPCASARAPFLVAHRSRSGSTYRRTLGSHTSRASAECQRNEAIDDRKCGVIGGGPAANVRSMIVTCRRQMLQAAVGILSLSAAPAVAVVEGYTPMTALKGKDYGKARMTYSDYITTPSGLQYIDLVEGTGATPGPNSLCVVDWDGYTIGYYGRPFEARNKSKGGSFTGDDKDFYRVKLGTGQVIPAFEEALKTMKVGGVRRIIVPEELGYPNNDFTAVGPQPTNFSGRRALDFVLKNQGLIDKTLLFNISLVRVE